MGGRLFLESIFAKCFEAGERRDAAETQVHARGVTIDEAAARAAMISPWSNGQTDGQITYFKLVRRQMYGRGKIDLLQARLIDAE